MDDHLIFYGVSSFINTLRLDKMAYDADQFYIDAWPTQLALYDNNLRTLIDSDARLKDFLDANRCYELDQLRYPVFSSVDNSHEAFFVYVYIMSISVQKQAVYSFVFKHDLFENDNPLGRKVDLKFFSANFLNEVKGFNSKQTIKAALYYFANIFGDSVVLKKYLYFKFFLKKI